MCLPFVCCGGDGLGRRLERGRVLRGGLEGPGLLGRLARGARLLLRLIFQEPRVGPDHHDHVAALLLRHGLNDGEVSEVADETVQDLTAEIRVRHLAPAKHDRDLHLVPRREEPRDVPLLGGIVVRVDLGAELDLLEAGSRLLLAGLFELHVSFVLVLAVVHDPAHRRIGLRRDLDEIQIERPSLVQRVAGIDHADLLAVRPDEADLWRPDPVFDPGILRNPASPLSWKKAPASPVHVEHTCASAPGEYRWRDRPRRPSGQASPLGSPSTGSRSSSLAYPNEICRTRPGAFGPQRIRWGSSAGTWSSSPGSGCSVRLPTSIVRPGSSTIHNSSRRR